MHGASFFALSLFYSSCFYPQAEIRDISYLELQLNSKTWRPETTNIQKFEDSIYENMVCPSHGHFLLQSCKLLTFQVML